MKRKSYLLIFAFILFLSGCSIFNKSVELEFDDFSECPTGVYDDIVVESTNLPDEFDKGYIYIYTEGPGKYQIAFHNPDYGYNEEEYIYTTYRASFSFSEYEYFYTVEIPENYYIYSATYVNTGICSNEQELETIKLQYDSSFIYLSKKAYTESEFREEFPEMFE